MELPIDEVEDIVEKLHNWEDHIPEGPIGDNMPLDMLHKFDALYKELGDCNEKLRQFAEVHAHDIHLQAKLENELHATIRTFFEGPRSQDLIQRSNVICGAFYQKPSMFADRLKEFEKLINRISAAQSVVKT